MRLSSFKGISGAHYIGNDAEMIFFYHGIEYYELDGIRFQQNRHSWTQFGVIA